MLEDSFQRNKNHEKIQQYFDSKMFEKENNKNQETQCKWIVIKSKKQ